MGVGYVQCCVCITFGGQICRCVCVSVITSVFSPLSPLRSLNDLADHISFLESRSTRPLSRSGSSTPTMDVTSPKLQNVSSPREPLATSKTEDRSQNARKSSREKVKLLLCVCCVCVSVYGVALCGRTRMFVL